jgi:hypothetical protein
MTTHKLTLGIATLAIAATTTSILLSVGCSNSSSGEPAPTRDSGSDSTTGDSGNSGSDSGVGTDSHVSADAATDAPAATDGATDAVSLDTGSCTSEASTRNTCYTDAQAAANPYNACSPYTVNCVPFTTAVPMHPTL